jgi:hypothetical protein
MNATDNIPQESGTRLGSWRASRPTGQSCSKIKPLGSRRRFFSFRLAEILDYKAGGSLEKHRIVLGANEVNQLEDLRADPRVLPRD